jgi:hypothetical protein
LRRRLLLLSTFVFLGLALVPITAANNGNKPDRRITLDQGDGTIQGECAFTVFVHIEGRKIDTNFSVRDRSVMKLLRIFPATAGR